MVKMHSVRVGGGGGGGKEGEELRRTESPLKGLVDNSLNFKNG